MKFCFVSHGDVRNLATLKRAFGMATPLCDASHDVSIILQDTPTNRERMKLECPNAIPKYYKPGSFRQEVAQKKEFLKELQPTVIYVCAFGIRNWVCPSFQRRKSIYLVEHSELRSGILNQSVIRRTFERALEWSTIVKFDGLICASRYLEKHYASRAKLAWCPPIHYSPYAFSKNIVSLCLPEGQQNIRDRYRGKKILLYMGTLARNYGILDVIEAISKLRKIRDDFVLLILSPGGRDEGIARHLAKNLSLQSYTDFLGYVAEDKIGNYLGATDLFIAPLNDTVQDWARCPSKLFLYIPYQKPIITCRIGEAIEIFKNNGYYYEYGSPSAMAHQIEQALSKTDPSTIMPDPSQHTWQVRTMKFLAWLNNSFHKHPLLK